MNILILRVSSIGDVVHTLPSAFLLKKLYPQAKIHWLVQKKAAEILFDQPFLDTVWVLPDKFLQPKNLPKTFSTIKKLKKIQWDAILDFQGILKTSLLLPFLHGEKYSFDTQNSRLWLTSFLSSHHITPTYTNIIQKNLSLADNNILRKYANKLGSLNPDFIYQSPTIETIKQSCNLSVNAENKKLVNQWLLKNNITKFIALSPNTTWASKHWPLKYWKDVIISLSKNYTIVLLGKAFGDQAQILSKDSSLAIKSSPRWNLSATSYLISKASLLIAPDTGLLHIADFLGVNTIGIFGPTLAKKHGPFLSSQNIKSCIQIECIHRYKKQHDTFDCMALLKPDNLLKKIKTNY